MSFSQYNKKVACYICVAIVVCIGFVGAAHPSMAQSFASRQQRSDYERFEMLRSTNRD